MKTILKNTILISSIVVALGSCKKDYLETRPTNQIPTSDVFRTTGNAWGAINGIHRSLYQQWLGNQDQGGQSANMIYMDVMGEDLVMHALGSSWFISDYRWQNHRNVNSRVPLFNYFFYYSIIGNANNIIAFIDAAEGPQVEKNQIKGQAYAYRGWAYFQMIQLFGKRFVRGEANNTLGLPLVLTPNLEGLPRSTVAEVYTQIHADLEEAATLLTGVPNRRNTSHIDLAVAKGLRARVFLAQQDWDNAARLASEARQGKALMSNAQYLQGFNDYTNPEWMWGIRQIDDQGTFFFAFAAYMSANFSSTHTRAVPKCINRVIYDPIPATDIRKQLWDPTGTNTAQFPVPTATGSTRMPYMTRKFLVRGSTSAADLPFMRTAEMFLIEAEAHARAGRNAQAQDALFTLNRNRDAQYQRSTNEGQALIDEIMLYRRVELWGEGFRFYDLKRLNLSMDRRNTNHPENIAVRMFVPAGDMEWEFLIPIAEINANPAIEQNPM